MSNCRRRLLPPLLSLLLAACATTPHGPPPVAPPPEPSAPVASVPVPAAEPADATEAAPDDVWQRLRASFAMDDCDADPQIDLWARRFTRSPARFEARVATLLPRLVYVQQIASAHQVAGEFALLPWVESRFIPVRGRSKGPAGMWQIMPITARTLALPRRPGYDGRLDVPVATEAVMTLLQRYQRRFDDWRLVDYAYNRGQFAVRRLLRKHGAPPPEPTIPDLPVRRVTREHLIKLLAIACVVRQPDRFHVSLPTLPERQRLVVVRIDRKLPLARAAADAGMPLAALRQLNGAFEKVADMPSPHLLLPREHALNLLSAHPESTMETALDIDRGGHPASPGAVSERPHGRPR